MRVAFTAVATVAMATQGAFAQQVVLQPESVAGSQLQYQNYYDGSEDTPSPSDEYVAPTFQADEMSMQPVTTASACCEPTCGVADDCCDSIGCGSCCGDLFGGCCLGDPWRLRDSLLGPCCWLDMGGWTQMGYHSDNTRLSAVRGDLGAFNDVPDGFNLHQQWLWFEKQAEAPCCGWDWGFRFDIMYGTDAQKTQAFGNDSSLWDAGMDHGVYGWAMPQAYVEIATGDWSIIAGHFFTLVGYEVVTAPDNFFYSHAFTMFNSEPFTHTGVLATYSGSDLGEFYAGYTLGWDTGFDQYNQNGTSGSSWLGGFSTNLTDDITFTYISTFGDFGGRNDTNYYALFNFNPGVVPAANANFAYSHSLVFDVQVNDCINYVLQSDIVSIDEIGHEQVGVNQYLFYEVNDCLSYGTRLEWWKTDGVSIHGLTGGINYRPHANLVIRPEVRYNWAPGEDAVNAAYVAGGAPANFDFNQWVFGIDAVLTF